MLYFFCIFLTLLLGILVVFPITSTWRFLERIALSWVLGLGFLTQGLFVLSLLNIDFSAFSISALLLTVDAILLVVKKNKIFRKSILIDSITNLKLNQARLTKETSIPEYLLFGFIIFLLISVFITALYWPVYYWDALALYDYRARIFTEAGGIAKSVAISSLPLHTYPPLTSLAHTFVYVLGGKYANPQYIYPLFYLALLITFYSSLRCYCRRSISLIFTSFLAVIPSFIEFASNAYTNLPYAFYYGMGTVYFFRFIQRKEKADLIISGLLLGFSGWTRSPTEQFFIMNIFVLLLWCIRQKKSFSAPAYLTLSFLLLAIPWRVFTYFVLKSSPIATEISKAVEAGIRNPFNFERFFTTIALLLKSMKGITLESLALVVIILVLFPKMITKNIYLLVILLGNLAIFVLGAYFFSLSWEDWKDSILNSANRLSMFMVPITLYFAAISVPTFLKSNHKNS